VISREAIYSWKGILVALSHAFDKEAIDDLLFLNKLKPSELKLSGDGVLKFARLIAADLATMHFIARVSGVGWLYDVSVSEKGRLLIEAWKAGNRELVAAALGAGSSESDSPDSA
jgi:hypothetical protein